MTRHFLIDTDTASDDAVALIMALRAPDVTIHAITVVGGNVPVDQGVRNALYTVELCGSDTPVYRGAARPLLREPVGAQGYHGDDGLGDRGYPPPRRSAAPGHAIDVLIETIRTHPGIELVTLGPLTNVALAVARAPEIVGLVGRCVVMGGNAWSVGNVTPAAEFNMWHDPEAARIVLHSGLPIELVTWELCRHEAVITPDEIALIRGFDTPLAHFAIDCNTRAVQAAYDLSGQIGIDFADPVAMAVALEQDICTRRSRHAVDVETQSELTRGLTVVDQLDVAHDAYNRAHWGPIADRCNVTICWAIDPARWKAALYRALT